MATTIVVTLIYRSRLKLYLIGIQVTPIVLMATVTALPASRSKQLCRYPYHFLMIALAFDTLEYDKAPINL
ncbi:hypothetical protein BG842_06180 [Haladaptatus sp. W1]|nr:hypothetical protein BG842_06180 [Haladaptatus sp. W1]